MKDVFNIAMFDIFSNFHVHVFIICSFSFIFSGKSLLCINNYRRPSSSQR
jgi:hypothetical protein